MTVTRIPSEIVAVPDFVTMTEPGPDKPMAELAVALVAMFTEDDSLPQPGYADPVRDRPGDRHAVRHHAGHLPRHGAVGRAVRRNRHRFPHHDVHGEPAVRCELRFAYAGVAVKAYAYIHTASTR